MKKQDLIFEWKGFGNGFGKWDSKCRIRIYENEEGHQIVIATELEENKGTSVTNCAEHLATMVVNRFEIPTNKLIWIEHYPEPNENFDFVYFKLAVRKGALEGQLIMRFEEPAWKHLERAHVEMLIGEPLE